MRPVLALSILVLACAAATFAWHLRDTRPPLQEEAQHLRAGLRCLRESASPPAPWRAIPFIISDGTPPPLLYSATLPLYLIAGTDRAVAGLVPVLFLSLMLVSVYGTGARLFSRTAGMLAAFILACYPLVIALSRLYLPDLPLAAMLSVTIYCALRAEGFRRGSWCAILGLALGLGMLTAWRFIIYAAPPLLLLSLPPRNELFLAAPRARKVRNLAATAAIAALVAAPWYACNLGDVLHTALPDAGRISYLPRLLLSPRALCQSILPPMAAFLVAGTAVLALRRKLPILLILWLLVPLASAAVFPHTAPRCASAALPAAALITAAGLCLIPRRAMRRLCVAAACAVSAVNAALLTVPIPWERAGALRAADFLRRHAPGGALGTGIFRTELPCCGMGPPRRESWCMEELLSDITRLSGATEGRKVPIAWFIAPQERFNRSSLLYTLEQGNYPLELVKPDKARFVLTRFVADEQAARFSAWSGPWLHCRTIKSYRLPDNSQAVLYAARPTRRRCYHAHELNREVGEGKTGDEDSSDGLARFADRDRTPEGALAMTPRHELEEGHYRLSARIRYQRPHDEKPVARITIEGPDDRAPLVTRELFPRDLGDEGTYTSVQTGFAMPRRGPCVCRIAHTGHADLWLDLVEISPAP